MFRTLISLVKKPVVSAHDQFNLTYEPYVLPSNLVTGTEWFNRLVFPSSEGLDKYELLKYQKSIIGFIDWIEQYKSFTVCGLDSILSASGLKVNDVTRDDYKALSNLHCIKFKNIPPDILEEIPMMINNVLSEGRFLKDVSPEVISS